MKKTFTLIFAMFMAICGNAQLIVNQYGMVGIGLDHLSTSSNTLTIGKKDLTGYGTSIYSRSNGILYLYNDTTNFNPTNGLYIKYISNKDITYANKVRAYGNGINEVIGTLSIAQNCKKACGVFGGLTNTDNIECGVGVYGSSYPTYTLLPMGIYAGYFRGDVKATGTIYGTLVSPSSVSSPSQGGTTINLSEEATRGEGITEKLRQVDLLQMERINQDGSIAANKAIKKATCINDEGEEVPAEDPVQTNLSPVSYGLAADQLKGVYPELVYEDKDGNYSINYIEIVPLLVQSIRELSAKMEALEAERDNPKAIKGKSSQMDIADNVNLSIPNKAQKIHLNIYDLSGKLVRTTDVNESGDVRLSTYTKGLPTGTYAYSLIVDGKKQKARKIMIK